jgi:MFS family permease
MEQSESVSLVPHPKFWNPLQNKNAPATSPTGREAATVVDGGNKQTHPNLILAICCMSLLVVGMDVTIVNVALPSIQRDLHATVSGLQWILDAYTLVIASLLMLAGSVSDRVGRRRVFQFGLLLFAAGSLLCSVAHTIGQLVAYRALQGLGASMLNPVALSIIANAFPEPRSRARAVGVWGAVAGASLCAGTAHRRRVDAICGLALHLLDQPANLPHGRGTGSAVRS